jgi:hypothetical protein
MRQSGPRESFLSGGCFHGACDCTRPRVSNPAGGHHSYPHGEGFNLWPTFQRDDEGTITAAISSQLTGGARASSILQRPFLCREVTGDVAEPVAGVANRSWQMLLEGLVPLFPRLPGPLRQPGRQAVDTSEALDVERRPRPFSLGASIDTADFKICVHAC